MSNSTFLRSVVIVVERVNRSEVTPYRGDTAIERVYLNTLTPKDGRATIY